MIVVVSWIIFFAAVILWSIFSIVFIFHWRHYSRQSKLAILAETIYFTVSAVLISSALATLNLKIVNVVMNLF